MKDYSVNLNFSEQVEIRKRAKILASMDANDSFPFQFIENIVYRERLVSYDNKIYIKGKGSIRQWPFMNTEMFKNMLNLCERKIKTI
jgi:hypothetical protein